MKDFRAKDSARGRISLWLSQASKEEDFLMLSELGILCVFARGIFFPNLESKFSFFLQNGRSLKECGALPFGSFPGEIGMRRDGL